MDKLWEGFPKAVGTVYNTSISNYTNTSVTNVSSCYAMTPYWANMFRPIDDPDYPWLGLWLSLPIIGIWYWCTDQVRLVIASGRVLPVHYLIINEML